jgi:hypothetical protein
MCALLLLQFLLGMVVNLFVTIPSTHPGSSGSNFFGRLVQSVQWAVSESDPALQLHAFLGLLLVLGAIRHAYVALRSRQSGWLVSSLVGAFGMVFAGFNGGSFVNYGHDINSLLMSIGFAVALSSYAVGLYSARRRCHINGRMP